MRSSNPDKKCFHPITAKTNRRWHLYDRRWDRPISQGNHSHPSHPSTRTPTIHPNTRDFGNDTISAKTLAQYRNFSPSHSRETPGSTGGRDSSKRQSHIGRRYQDHDQTYHQDMYNSVYSPSSSRGYDGRDEEDQSLHGGSPHIAGVSRQSTSRMVQWQDGSSPTETWVGRQGNARSSSSTDTGYVDRPERGPVAPRTPPLRSPANSPNAVDLHQRVPHRRYTNTHPPPPSPSPRQGHKCTTKDTDSSDLTLSRLGMKVVAIDCEMVGCLEVNLPWAKNKARSNPAARADHTLHRTQARPMSRKRKKPVPTVREVSVAGRCSVVDYEGVTLYDSFINPHLQILNLRTRYSGITRRDIAGAPPFHVARSEVLRLLDGCTVVGHAIVNDLNSLDISLPSERIRDTSLYKPLRRMSGLSESHPPSLKKLALILLGYTIQNNTHCSLEDARATMDVYKVVELQWESSQA